MEKKQLLQLGDRFESFVAACDVPKESANLKDLKHRHSHRVRDFAERIARALGWAEGDVVTASALGLLHDVGRFPQVREFGHFRDHDSFDHGQRGAEILAGEGWLSDCGKAEREAIITGVALHNVHVIPEDVEKDILPFVRLIRDADKLDIMQGVFQELLARESEKGNLPPPSPVLVERAMAHKLIDYKDAHSLSDMLLSWVVWAYDFNFAPSRAILRESGMIGKIIRVLPDTPEMRRIDADTAAHLAQA